MKSYLPKFKFQLLLGCVLALGVLALQAAPSLAAPVLNAANNHYYESVAVAGGVTWADARTAAAARVYQGLSGHLVTMASSDENQFVYQNCPAAISGNWWIGGYQDKSGAYSEPGGNWKWIDGSAIQYFNWQSGEPNNNAGYSPPDDYLQILSNGKWNDNTGVIKLGGYVVEYDASAPTGKIAFSTGDIFVINADGTNATNLTHSAAYEDSPSFNGDGSKIAYSSEPTTDASGAAASEIYLMNSDGSNATRLTNNSYYDGEPQLSHDGSKIVYISNRGNHAEIYLMNSDGSNQTRLTNTTSGAVNPAWSPDGTKIAFIAGFDVFLMNTDGSNQVNLTHSGTDQESQPAWSPDGSTLYFVDAPSDAYTTLLYSMKLDGTSVHLISGNYNSCNPVVSPDGLWVADNGITLGRAEGNYQFNLTQSGYNPAWAPGSVPAVPVPTIAVDDASSIEGDSPTISLANTTTPQVIFTIHFNNARLQSYTFTYRMQPLSATPNNDYYPLGGTITFAPGETQKQISVPVFGDLLHEPTETFALVLTDATNTVTGKLTAVGTIIDDDAEAAGGGKIAFMSSRDGNNEIYEMNADGTSQTNITNAPNNDRQPKWSNDGSKIVFSRGQPSGNGGADIYTMNEDGSNLLNLTNDGPDDMEPQYSPDGYSVVYSSFGGSDYDVFKVSSSGGARTRIVNNPLGDYHPRLNPAGTKILFHTFPDSQTADIFVANADGSGQVQLTSGGGNDANGEWSPQGDKIAFSSQRDGNNEIYVMSADGSNPTRLTNNSAVDDQPCWSPDGSQIAFTSNRDGNYEIYVMNADGSGQARITNSAGDDTSPSWATGEVLAARPSLAVNDIAVSEGQTATFTVTLSKPSARKIDVAYETSGGTATAQSDYAYTSGTLSFAPGETSKSISIPVRYDSASDDGEYFFLNLSNPRNALLGDAQGKCTIAERGRPDLAIKRAIDGETYWVGRTLFYAQPSSGNTRSYYAGAGDVSAFQVEVKNTSGTPLSFVLKPSESEGGTPLGNGAWTTTFETVGVDVTASFQSADGYTTPLLSPGDTQIFTVRITPNGDVPIGSVHALDITAAQGSEPNSACDLVRAQVVRGVRQPDLLIAAPTDAQAIGDGVYSPSSTTQEKQLDATANQKATYLITLQNDGEAPDSFNVYSFSSATGWNVKTFDAATGGNDISYSIYSGQGFTSGWNSSVMQPGQSTTLRLEVTPDATLAPGAAFSFLMYARSNNDTFKIDSVKATTSVFAPSKPDLQIKKGGEDDASYALNNVYQSTPAGGQIQTQSITPGATATYNIAVDNDSAVGKSFVIRAIPNAATGWTSTYKLGTLDITSQITGDGYNTGNIDADARKVFTLTLTPLAGSGHRDTKQVVFQAFADGTSIPVLDAVEAVANASNIAPTAYDQSVALNEDASTAITLKGDDGDGDALGFSIESLPSHGALFAGQNASGHQIAADELPYALAANKFFFVPAPNWNGSDNFTFAVSDASAQSTSATVSIAVNAVNDAPVLAPIPDAGGKKGSVITFTAHATDVDGDVLHFSLIDAPDGADIDDATGAFSWTPSPTELTGAHKFQVRVFDGTVNVETPVKITVYQNNTPPLATNDEYSAHQDIALSVDAPGVLNNDSDAENQNLSATKIAGPQHGTLVLNSSGAFSYTPNAGFSGDDGFSYQANDGALNSATADAVIHVAPNKADLLIKRDGEDDAAYASDNVYQSTPSGNQIETQKVAVGGTAKFWVKVQNDDAVARSFVVKGSGSAANWTSTFKSGASDITSQISGAGYATSTLAAGASEIIAVELKPQNGAAGASTLASTLQVFFSQSDTTPRDVVRASATLSSYYQSDLLIRSDGETGGAGDGIYNATGANQTRAQSVANTHAATYWLTLQNDGNASDTFKIKSAPLAAGWSAKYFDGATEITSQVLGAGWISPSLNAGATRDVKVLVTPGATVAHGVSQDALISVASQNDVTKSDAVLARTTAIAQPDLLIKKLSDADSTYALNDVYQSTPAGNQIKSQLVAAGVKATYSVKIQNDGVASRAFVLKAVEGGESGWTVAYKFGSTIITTALKSAAGYTTSTLAAGATQIITLEMTPSSSATGVNANKTATLNAFSVSNENVVRDSVCAATIATPPLIVGIDASIRKASETTFTGDGIVNTTGANQTSTQTTPRNRAAIFVMRLKNSGNNSDSLKLAASGSATGWSVKYFDVATGADISTAVARGTWSTPSLAANAAYDVRIEITPSSSASLNLARTWTLTATSTKDATKKDVVKATATASAS